MSHDLDDDDGLGWIDALARAAADAAPPPMDPDDAPQRVARAMTEAATRRVQEARRRTTWAIGVAAAALLALGGVGMARMLGVGDVHGGGGPLVMQLPTGDRVTATEGARFRMTELDASVRGVVVDDGAVLFDVRALREGERFEVTSGATRVRVRGTVFSVRRAGDAVEVQVYEGHVDVTNGRERWAIGAGRRWANGREAALDPDAPLAREGRDAATLRSRTVAAATTVTSPPTAMAAAATTTTSAQDPTSGSSVSTGATGETDAPAPRASERTTSERTTTTTTTSVADARRWLSDGEAERAFEAARSRSGGAWRMVEADALRALGRNGEAADGYDRAARELGGSARAQAGYLAATLRRGPLGDAAGALRSLRASGAADPGSPLEERALVLYARLLVATGHGAEAREAAARYVVRFPEGGRRNAMERIAHPEAAADDAAP